MWTLAWCSIATHGRLLLWVAGLLLVLRLRTARRRVVLLLLRVVLWRRILGRWLSTAGWRRVVLLLWLRLLSRGRLRVGLTGWRGRKVLLLALRLLHLLLLWLMAMLVWRDCCLAMLGVGSGCGDV